MLMLFSPTLVLSGEFSSSLRHSKISTERSHFSSIIALPLPQTTSSDDSLKHGMHHKVLKRKFTKETGQLNQRIDFLSN